MKTPEEIEKGLECHFKHDGSCDECPYNDEPDCSRLMYMDANDCIQQLEARVPRWIPVEERLPECNKNVIVFVQHPISGHKWLQMAHHVSALGLDECEDDEWWLNRSGETVSYITHWMPLPEPPKEEHHE